MITSQILGTLVRDPEKIETSASSFVVFTVASNNKKIRQNEEPGSTFVNCTFFGKKGEVVLNNLSKGDPIFVFGELSERSWERGDKQGKNLTLEVSDFQFVGSKKSREEESEEPVATPAVTSRKKASIAATAEDEYDPFAEN